MLGSLILYLKGMRTTMFQLSGFYYRWIQKRRNFGAGGSGLSVPGSISMGLRAQHVGSFRK